MSGQAAATALTNNAPAVAAKRYRAQSSQAWSRPPWVVRAAVRAVARTAGSEHHPAMAGSLPGWWSLPAADDAETDECPGQAGG